MGISVEELALKEMRAVIAKLDEIAPNPQFTSEGAGPYFTPSDEYREHEERLRWLRARFPGQWKRLPEEDRWVLELPMMTLESLQSLSSSLGSPIGVAPEAA